ncbi:MAG TPA: response regulator, partial [Vitreimonas sp.]|nr:response regulator [Vitreimonas sp.]
VQARIFEPFFTTQEIGRGTGLGLAQVHGFAPQSGGRVEVKSAPGRGTTMTLVLPRASQDHVEAPKVEAPARPSSAQGGMALLVEDDDEVAAFTSEMLKDLGFDVMRASSGEAALKIITSGQSIDLVFSDVMMPGGMTGLELAAAARARRPNMPVLLASGYTAPFTQDAAKRGLLLLAKPFTTEALAHAIDKARSANS